ncbi:MAG: translesion DNA synthesis-associated protein ImuA [Paraburkholderia sp.]
MWRGTQLARARGYTLDTGYANLSAELPGGGWPLGALVEIMISHPGSGEIRLLAPALANGRMPVALIAPPHEPAAAGWSHIGIAVDRLLVVRAPRTSDALWSAEQILRNGTCSALILWQQHIQVSSLRRLHLAAKAGNTLFCLMRPLAAAQDASPAELRIAVRATENGASVQILKRKGPSLDDSMFIELRPTPVLISPRGRVPRSVRETSFQDAGRLFTEREKILE